ncbi:MAG: hypothetical protein A2297_00525 [Elusimicrobia bacterium RIFOXYB2_FULL_48_7]|nr:MAG: hypothetical protein A2297_00525 [Elusimicrobia bacterium RIFOXYB2_FULL_48_7]
MKNQNISCKQTEALINKQIDAIITAEEAGLLKAHLDACASCARESQSLLKLHNLFQNNLSNTAVPALSNDFDSVFRKKLEEATTSEPGLLDNIKEALAGGFKTVLQPRYTMAVVTLALLITIGIRGHHIYDSVKAGEAVQAARLARAKVVVNSEVLYEVAVKKTSDKALTNLANSQAKEIISIAGI